MVTGGYLLARTETAGRLAAREDSDRRPGSCSRGRPPSASSTSSSGICLRDLHRLHLPQESGKGFLKLNIAKGIAEEEVDDSVVETSIKVLKACRRKRGAVKKRSKKANNSEASSTMALVRVLAVSPGGSEQLFDIAEADPTPRVTRQKVKDKALSTKDGSPLEQNVGSLPQQNVESSLQLIVESSPHMDVGYGSMDEGSTVRMDLSPIAPTMARKPLDSDVFSEGPVHPTSDEGTAIVLGRKRKGSGLEKITTGLGCKVRIEIAPGMRRPEKPVQAAKFASEGGMIARGHTPILPHFKEYKKDKNLVKDFIWKVAGNLELDTED